MTVCLVTSLPSHLSLLGELRDVGACGQARGTTDTLVTECGVEQRRALAVWPRLSVGRAEWGILGAQEFSQGEIQVQPQVQTHCGLSGPLPALTAPVESHIELPW